MTDQLPVTPTKAPANRMIPADELIALTTVELVDRGMHLAIQILGQVRNGPIDQVSTKVDRAIALLSRLSGETHHRQIAAGRQQVADDITAAVTHRLTEINAAVDAALHTKR